MKCCDALSWSLCSTVLLLITPMTWCCCRCYCYCYCQAMQGKRMATPGTSQQDLQHICVALLLLLAAQLTCEDPYVPYMVICRPPVPPVSLRLPVPRFTPTLPPRLPSLFVPRAPLSSNTPP